MSLELPPRLVDWSIFVGVCFAFATGLVSLVSGAQSDAVVFVLHGMGGLALVVLVFWKLRRVHHRVTSPSVWDRYTPASILLAILVLAALATGSYWVFGGTPSVGPWTLLFVHMALGVLVIPVLLVHLRGRFLTPSTSDFEGRRTILSFIALIGFGALAWRLQREINRVLGLAGTTHRFTGSKEEGTDAGNDFPVTSWVADDPEPIDTESWRLSIHGNVEQELVLDTTDLTPEHEQRAPLDCTSGWYSVHDWQGLRVGDLLSVAGPTDNAQWISFRSVTGYRFSLPLEEAKEALLATHTDGERLSHDHGFPLRLVAPGRRGFQWVKWVEAMEVRQHRDLSEWLAIFVSGFDQHANENTTAPETNDRSS